MIHALAICSLTPFLSTQQITNTESPDLWPGAIDPEIHSSASQITYQDPQGNIWLERLNSTNGGALTGSRQKLDSSAVELRATFNGPEFGITRHGSTVFYTKLSETVPQIWGASCLGNIEAKPLWNDGLRRQSVLASKHIGSSSQRVIYIKGTTGSGSFHWADISSPQHEHFIVRTNKVDSPRWIEGSHSLVFAEAGIDRHGQVALLDTDSGKSEQVSDDPLIKSFAYGWLAPEADGKPMVLALMEGTAIGVWKRGETGWRLIQKITIPNDSKNKIFGSPEPFVFKGRSYISAVIKDSDKVRFSDGEVWVFALSDGGASSRPLLVSDKESRLMRSDPETFVTEDAYFVYYNIFCSQRGYRIGCSKVASGEAPKDEAALFPYQPDISQSPQLSVSRPSLVLKDEARDKALPVRITYPAQGKGPFPIVVFSHGAWGSKDGHVMLSELWAQHGIVVVQPDHQDSRNLGVQIGDRSVFRYWQERPRDLKFVLDSLHQIEEQIPELKGKLDLNRVGASGHSYGANTAQIFGGAVAFTNGRPLDLGDSRVKAIALLSGQGPGEMLTENSWVSMKQPLLVMTGSKDGPTRTGQTAEWRRLPYELSPAGDKYLAWVIGMDHGFGGVSGLKDGLYEFQKNQDHIAYTKKVTLAFWEAALKGNAGAKTYLKDNVLGRETSGAVEISSK